MIYLNSSDVFANDSAAGLAASGIQFKEEKNISIESEDLYISPDKVEVSYLFKNHSDKDIATLIAFPVPEYFYDTSRIGAQGPNFDDFTVEVDGKAFPYKTEERALLHGKDYSQLLKAMSVPIKGYGEIHKDGIHDITFTEIFKNLSVESRKKILDTGLVTSEQAREYTNYEPQWSVSLKYYWTQLFPKNATVKIKHTYSPSTWYDYMQDKYYKAACIPGNVRMWLRNTKDDTPASSHVIYVKYILKTANNWRQPIKKLRLIVERPSDAVDEFGQRREWRSSMCFDNPLKTITDNRYEVIMRNYIPKKILPYISFPNGKNNKSFESRALWRGAQLVVIPEGKWIL